ncbi:MAG: hypothetical protein RLZZ299_2628 [Pseudomonadota bacterium]
METSERPTLGERVASRLERLSSRERRRPRLAFSPTLYARLGVDDPWGVPGSVAGEAEPGDGFVFLSAQPYYAMLRRLAAARRRRERRLERFGAPRLGEGRVASVAVPSAGLSLVPSRLARLAAGDWTLPAAPAPVAAPATEPAGAFVPAPRVDGFVPARKGGWAGWAASSSTSVRAASSDLSSGGGGGSPLRNASPSASRAGAGRVSAPERPDGPAVRAGTGPRPLDRIGRDTPHRALPARLAAALEEAVATVAPARRALVRRVEESIAFLPAEEQVVAVRKLVRVLGVRARAAQDEIAVMAAEPAARAVTSGPAARAGAARSGVGTSPVVPVGTVGEPDVAFGPAVARVPAVVRAAHRMDAEAPVPTGLRPVLGRSPAMALASSADIDRASAGTLAEAERSERAPSSTSGARPVRAAAARAAARASAGAPRPGSALPAAVAMASAPRVSSLVPRAVVRAAVRDSEGRPGAERPSASFSSLRRVEVAGAQRADADIAAVPAPRAEGASRGAGGPAERERASGSGVGRALGGRASSDETPATVGTPPAIGRTLGTGGTRAGIDAPADARTREDAESPVLRGGTTRRLPASARAVARAHLADAAVAAASPDAVLSGRVEDSRVEGHGSTLDRGVLGRVAASRADRVPAPDPATVARPGESRAEGLRVRRAAVAAEGVVPQFARDPIAPSEGASSPAVPAAATAAPRTRPAAWPAPRAEARPDAEAVPPRVVGTVWAGVRASSADEASRSVLPSRTPRDVARNALGASVLAARVDAVPGATDAVSASPEPVERAAARSSRATRGARVSPPRASVAPEMRPLATAAAPDPSAVPVHAAEPVRRAASSRGAVVAAAARASRVPVTVLADVAGPGSGPASGRRVEGPLAFARGARTLPAERGVGGPSVDSVATDGRVALVAARRAGAAGRPASVAPDALVRTPEGRFDSARAVVARGLVVVATTQGLIAAPAAEAASVFDVPAAGSRDPRAGRSVEARAAAPARRVAAATPGVSDLRAAARAMPVRVESGVVVAGAEPAVADASVGAVPVRPRAVERASARARVEESSAYRGAYRTSRAVRAEAGSTVVATDAQDVVGAAPVGAPSDAPAPGRVAGGRRRGDTGVTTRTTVRRPTEPSVARAAGAAGDAEAVPEPGTTASPRRGSFDERMARVAAGRTDGATGWVDRAEGSPRLSTVSGLIQALARATSNEDVVRVIAARGDLSQDATRLPLDAPAVQVIQQIRDEVRDEVAAAAEPVIIGPSEVRASRLSAPQATSLAPQALGSVESTARVVRGRAVRSAATARRAAGAEDRLSRLVRRLQDLIHLAEDQNRLAEARSQVRMAEDSAEARAEGQGPVVGASADTAKADIEALGRDVLDAVTKELELRRARRMEDGDESPWW